MNAQDYIAAAEQALASARVNNFDDNAAAVKAQKATAYAMLALAATIKEADVNDSPAGNPELPDFDALQEYGHQLGRFGGRGVFVDATGDVWTVHGGKGAEPERALLFEWDGVTFSVYVATGDRATMATRVQDPDNYPWRLLDGPGMEG